MRRSCSDDQSIRQMQVEANTFRLCPQLRGSLRDRTFYWKNSTCMMVNESSINGAHSSAALCVLYSLRAIFQFMYYDDR